MMSMSVHIKTAAELKGHAWAKKYPGKADEIYVVARFGKKRKVRRFGPPTPENQAAAKRTRDDWAAALDRKDLSARGIVSPLFEDAVKEYQRQGMGSHAPRTKSARKYQFKRMTEFFGTVTLMEIDAERIVKLHGTLRGDGFADRTCRRYLDALSNVYQWHDLPNPVPAARVRIAKMTPSTAISRGLDASNCNPVAAATMGKLLPRLSGDLLTTVLLCYEGGFRIGEAVGIRWEDVTFGSDDDDTTRSLLIQRTRSGTHSGTTKSGLARRVSMSRRLRHHLLSRFMKAGRPASGWVLTRATHGRIHDRLGRAAKAAKVEKPKFKDFRDTYASTLITHGIVLKWISLQLGHASVSITEKHYARYMAVEGYQNPWIVPAGCLPSDLFADLDGWNQAGVTKESLSVTTVHN